MKQKKLQYDTKKLFLQGLLAFGGMLGRTVEKTYMTKRQVKARKAFKASCAARRLQRRLAS